METLGTRDREPKEWRVRIETLEAEVRELFEVCGLPVARFAVREEGAGAPREEPRATQDDVAPLTDTGPRRKSDDTGVAQLAEPRALNAEGPGSTPGASVSDDPHPDYGPCDDFGEDGVCSECSTMVPGELRALFSPQQLDGIRQRAKYVEEAADMPKPARRLAMSARSLAREVERLYRAWATHPPARVVPPRAADVERVARQLRCISDLDDRTFQRWGGDVRIDNLGRDGTVQKIAADASRLLLSLAAPRAADRDAEPVTDLEEAAWGVIANAMDAMEDWREWTEAAIRWRERYHAKLAAGRAEAEQARCPSIHDTSDFDAGFCAAWHHLVPVPLDEAKLADARRAYRAIRPREDVEQGELAGLPSVCKCGHRTAWHSADAGRCMAPKMALNPEPCECQMFVQGVQSDALGRLPAVLRRLAAKRRGEYVKQPRSGAIVADDSASDACDLEAAAHLLAALRSHASVEVPQDAREAPVWFVERDVDGAPMWYAGEGRDRFHAPRWTRDANDAVPFADKAAAEAKAAYLMATIAYPVVCKATEHLFVAMRAVPQDEERERVLSAARLADAIAGAHVYADWMLLTENARLAKASAILRELRKAEPPLSEREQVIAKALDAIEGYDFDDCGCEHEYVCHPHHALNLARLLRGEQHTPAEGKR